MSATLAKRRWIPVWLCLAALIGVSGAASDEPDWSTLNTRLEERLCQGRYQEAVTLGQEAVNLAEANYGPDHLSTAHSLHLLAESYRLLARNDEAEPLYRRSLAIRESTLGPDHPKVADSLTGLALLARARAKYAEAETLLRRCLAIREKALGADHTDVADALASLAIVVSDQGRYAEAEPLAERSVTLRERALGPDHADVAASLRAKAELRYAQGKYAEAEELYRRVLAIRERALPPDHPDLATSLDNLADLLINGGQYREAETLCRRGLQIREKALGVDHPHVAYSLNNLGLIYQRQGRYAEAEPIFQRSLAIREARLGPEHPGTGVMVNNLASLARRQGHLEESERLFRRCLTIWEKAYGPEHPHVAAALHNLAAVIKDEERYQEAEPLAKRALGIWEKTFGVDNPEIAFALTNLAEIYRARARYEEAQPLLERSLAVREATFGPRHPDVGTSLSELAVLAYARRLPGPAAEYFDRAQVNLVDQFEYHFTYMSERDRLAFLETVAGFFPKYYSFCLTFKDERPDLLGKMYDLALSQKNFVGRSIAALRARAARASDPETPALLERLAEKRARIGKLATATVKNPAETREAIEALEKEANQIEKDLVQQYESFGEDHRLARVSWRDVQKSLGPRQAAVELLRFAFHDGQRFTDTRYYVALILTAQTTDHPKLVVLGEAQALEESGLADVAQHASRPATRLLVHASGPTASPSAGALANAWASIVATLGPVERVYLSPDGLLNQVPWGVIPTPGGKPLIETLDLRLVSSTRDMLRLSETAPATVAVLIGGPEFGLDEAHHRITARALASSDATRAAWGSFGRNPRSQDTFGARITPLPGAKSEIDSLRGLFRDRHWQVEALSGADAIEEAVKRVEHPRVLHLATHGFFLRDQEPIAGRRGGGPDRPFLREEPMLRSGLVFAGAERLLSGVEAPRDLEDGVLTAYEATGLNLHGTELVTLSACETGLGEVKAGEGVLGLRRAFELAGAESVLMTLWAVPDRETRELMTSFYRKWLAGQDKHVALRAAQLEMRARTISRYGHDEPFFWAAFVMVGR